MTSGVQISLAVAIVICVCGNGDAAADDCGIIYVDKTEVKKHDYVCDPLRTIEYITLWDNMLASLKNHPSASSYIYGLSTIEKVDPHLSVGTPVCPSETKKILGYFKRYGKVLCLVVKPDLQQVEQVTCIQKQCCNNASLCRESGIFTQRYLVFCDFFIPDKDHSIDIIDDDPGLCDVDALIEDQDDSDNGDLRRKRLVAHSQTGYFAFKFSELATTCSCGQCNRI